MPDFDVPVLRPNEVRYLRQVYGWSQVELGTFLGRDAATISRWESGHYVPDPLAAGVLYRLWLHAFGNEYPDVPEQPAPTEGAEALRKLALGLLTAGVTYFIARGLEGLGDDDE